MQEPEGLVSIFNTSLDVVDSPYAAHTRRQINIGQEAYDKALCKGMQLVRKVNQNFHYRKSPYSVYEQLAENGWTYTEINRPLPRDLTAAISDLRISATEQENVFVSLDHDKEFANRYARKVVSYRLKRCACVPTI